MATTVTAGLREVAAVARFRRAQNVSLDLLASRYGCSTAWLSKVLGRQVIISRDELKLIRAHVAMLGRERMEREAAEREGGAKPR